MKFDSAAFGEILRDEGGKWILGYNKYLGNCSVLWRILDSPNVLLNKKFDRILV